MTDSKKAVRGPDVIEKWSEVVLRFLRETGHLKEAMCGQLAGVVSVTVKARNLRGLRHVQRDLRDMLDVLSEQERSKLDDLLAPWGGVNGDDRSELTTILRRGTVENEDEYRLLMHRIDQIFQDPSKRDELDLINAVLEKSPFQ